MPHTYDELNNMTVAQLREVAEAQESDDLKGYKSMHKGPLLEALCSVLGVAPHVEHAVEGIDKAAIKARMRTLKEARRAAIEAHDHAELKKVRRRLHRLNRRIRRATVQAAAPTSD